MSDFLELFLILVIATSISATRDDREGLEGREGQEGSRFPAAYHKVQEVLTALDAGEVMADLKATAEEDGERTINWPTHPPTIIIQPTPGPVPFDPILVDPTPRPTAGPVIPAPTWPVAVPPPASSIPSGLQPLCGRRGTCYAWVKDELELFQGGLTKCDALHEYRARRYCCVDANRL